MSTITAEQLNQLENLSPDQAKAILAQNVGHPMFFQKLAQWNLKPTNAKEAEQYLQLAEQLWAAKAESQVKQASAGNPFLSEEISRLDGILREQGLATTNDAPLEAYIKKAAFELTQQPAIAYAALAHYNNLTAVEEAANAATS